MIFSLKNLINLLRTIGITLLLVVIGVFFAVWHAAIEEYNIATGKISKEIKVSEITIDQLLSQEAEHPEDYIINIKLAIAYQQEKMYSEAETQYQKALSKAPKSELVLYRYALYCVEMKKFAEAINLIENISDSPSKRVIGRKLAIYQKISEKLIEIEDYQNAAKIFTLAYRYARVLGGEPKEKVLKGMEEAFIKLADLNIHINNHEDAKLNLEALLKYTDSTLAEYKLALMYKTIDMEKSARLLEKVFLKDYKMVNLELYYDILEELKNKYKASGNRSKESFYKYKQEKLIKFVSDNLIFTDDFAIDNVHVICKKGFKPKCDLAFSIRNTTKNYTHIVYLKIKLVYPNGKEEIVDTAVAFPDKKEKQEIFTNLAINPKNANKGLDKSNYLQVTYSARKNRNAEWIFLRTINVKYQ
ncbi:hypothetical protein IKA15_03850 [bacterium]|nr:hypothetical protein [bacterium]